MGSAILTGLRRSNAINDEQLFIYDPNKNAPEGIVETENIIALSKKVDLLILAVKPPLILPLLREIKSERKLKTASFIRPQAIISVAAGISLRQLRNAFPSSLDSLTKMPFLFRAMSNTAAAVNMATTAIVKEKTTTKSVSFSKINTSIEEIFKLLGIVVELDNEDLMHAYIGIAGSGPAFAYVFAEALADGAVAEGLPRRQAQKLAASMMAGAAALLIETGGSPAVLKDAVASPAGTTIEGLIELEKHGFRAATIAAVRATSAKSRKIGKS